MPFYYLLNFTNFHSLHLKGSSLANGGLSLHSTVKRKLEGEKDYVFDKRLRYSVRQNESNCRFRDIVVRKEDGFTHILLSSQTSDNNALTPEVCRWTSKHKIEIVLENGTILWLSGSDEGMQQTGPDLALRPQSSKDKGVTNSNRYHPQWSWSPDVMLALLCQHPFFLSLCKLHTSNYCPKKGTESTTKHTKHQH